MAHQIDTSQTGIITESYNGAARVSGLSGLCIHEVLADKEGTAQGLVFGYEGDEAEVLLFNQSIDPTTQLYHTHHPFEIAVDDEVVGRMLNGLAEPIDGFGTLQGDQRSVFQTAVPMIDRAPITRPLTTGIKLVDTTLAVGRGQRQLIVGDRKLGKRTLAIDTILNQKHTDAPVYCVYVMTGKKGSTLRDTVDLFEERNAFLYSTIVSAPADAPLVAQHLAPFIGTAIAEYFRDSGRDALVVYDDLSRHAAVYRTISLLFRRPPGREAYPGDIFALHAQLLERAGQLAPSRGGGSLTALPIAETLEGDITAFIPTNLISITDGQIYLERGLFQKGFLPAINVGLSVSRVGSAAQPPALTSVVSGIRLALSQYKELQKLSQLETAVSEDAKNKIHRGALVLELLKQHKHVQVDWPEQVVLFYAVENGFFDNLDEGLWNHFESVLRGFVRTRHLKLLDQIRAGHFSEEVKQTIHTTVDEFKQEFLQIKTQTS